MTSDERKKAWLLLGAVIGLTLGQVGLSLAFNQWWGTLWDSLSNRDTHAFIASFGMWAGAFGAWVAARAYRPYLSGKLHILWRDWLTRETEGEWFDSKAYYRMNHDNGDVDNPDQRMSNDIFDFVVRSLTLSTSLLEASASMAVFSTVLWQLSGVLNVSIGGYNVGLPGYMVGLAMLYSGLGTYAMQKIGKKLPFIQNNQARYEADYRYCLIRARENAESIALSGGEEVEKGILRARFNRLVKNTHVLLKKNKQLNWFANAFGTIANPLPIVALAPRYFAGAITLGALQQGQQAFGFVQGAFSFGITAFNDFAQYKTTTSRVASYRDAISRFREEMASPVTKLAKGEATGSSVLDIRDLTVATPDGQQLIKPFSLTLNPGDRMVLTGVAGSGKSTLLRAMSGLWDHAEGEIRLSSEAKILCVPQKPYLPLTTLRGLIAYPEKAEKFDDAQIVEAMTTAGIDYLEPFLDDETKDGAYWSRRLSGGQHQRVAFARIFLHKPDVLLLDEVTSSLDPAGESDLYNKVVEKLPETTIISIAHREKVMHFHTLHGHIRDRQFSSRSLPPPGPQ